MKRIAYSRRNTTALTTVLLFCAFLIATLAIARQQSLNSYSEVESTAYFADVTSSQSTREARKPGCCSDNILQVYPLDF